jgi:hypothetical protein
MSWILSRFRSGDLVEVRSKDEILATLDAHGCIEGMPFMPEMLQYCGQRFQVSAVAHKTCDTVRQTWKSRRLNATVHLSGLRCNGSAHGGCQAECNLFWKDAWLKPAQRKEHRSSSAQPLDREATPLCCTEADLFQLTQTQPASDLKESRYCCQATQVFEATEPLSRLDPRQYFYDVWCGNRSAPHVVRVLLLSWFRWLLAHVPRGYRLVKWITDFLHRRLTGHPAPSLSGKIQPGMPTPTGRLDLKPGEYVRIKSTEEIELTLDAAGKNRGLGFDPEEMAPYCGGVYKVWKSVTQIIDEPTGKMIRMKQPCIMLEGVVCRGDYASCRLNCPRAIPAYWREIWLERVPAPASADPRETASHPQESCAEAQATGVCATPSERVALPLLTQPSPSDVSSSGIVA